MKVTLACPADWIPALADAGIGGNADDTIDVDGPIADRLVAEGKARFPDNVGALSGTDVDVVAAAEGVDLSGAATVTEKRDRVRAARADKEG